MRLLTSLAIVVLASLESACSTPNPACFDPKTYGLILAIGETTSAKFVCDATVKSTPDIPITRNSECRYVGPTARPGTYDVTIEAPGYKSTTTKVVLVDDGCGAKQKSGGVVFLEPL